VERLRRAGCHISMTQENHCYENAQAERLNGILRQEYGLGPPNTVFRAATGRLSDPVHRAGTAVTIGRPAAGSAGRATNPSGAMSVAKRARS